MKKYSGKFRYGMRRPLLQPIIFFIETLLRLVTWLSRLASIYAFELKGGKVMWYSLMRRESNVETSGADYDVEVSLLVIRGFDAVVGESDNLFRQRIQV